MDLVIRYFRIPMKLRFRGVSERAGALIRGPAGWGEFSPFPDYGPDVTRLWLDAALEAAHRGWPHPVRARIPVNATVPAVDPDTARALVTTSGCTTAKVKVADGDDDARVAAVRDALGASGRIRIDANGAWDVDAAVRHIRRLQRHDLEYVEQPVATLDDMARVRRAVDVPIAADESIRTAADPIAAKEKGAADIVVLKVQPLGGVRRALRVAADVGLPAVVSSAVETSVGLAAGVALAAALPELPYACGLATLGLLDGDVVAQPLAPRDGFVDVRGVDVDEAALARYELTGADAGRLRDRLEGAFGARV